MKRELVCPACNVQPMWSLPRVGDVCVCGEGALIERKVRVDSEVTVGDAMRARDLAVQAAISTAAIGLDATNEIRVAAALGVDTEWLREVLHAARYPGLPFVSPVVADAVKTG